MLGRLRVLLPAWRFFDRAIGGPRLWIRYGAVALGPWTALEVLAPWSRRSTRWAFAAADNLMLAYQTAVEQLVAELGELEREDDDAGLVSYALVTRIARAVVPGEARLQWKITVPDDAAGGAPGDADVIDYLVSPMFPGEAI